MPDEEIYKITFDLDSGVASELNSLNNRLSQIQTRTKVLDRGFKEKAEQSALVGAFASGMQMERNKANVTKVENNIIKRVILNQPTQKKQQQGNVISYETFKRAVEQVQMYKNESMLKSKRISKLGLTLNSLQDTLKARNFRIKQVLGNLESEREKKDRAYTRIRELERALRLQRGTGFNKVKVSQIDFAVGQYGLQNMPYQQESALSFDIGKLIDYKAKIG